MACTWQDLEKGTILMTKLFLIFEYCSYQPVWVLEICGHKKNFGITILWIKVSRTSKSSTCFFNKDVLLRCFHLFNHTCDWTVVFALTIRLLSHALLAGMKRVLLFISFWCLVSKNKCVPVVPPPKKSISIEVKLFNIKVSVIQQRVYFLSKLYKILQLASLMMLQPPTLHCLNLI